MSRSLFPIEELKTYFSHTCSAVKAAIDEIADHLSSVEYEIANPNETITSAFRKTLETHLSFQKYLCQKGYLKDAQRFVIHHLFGCLYIIPHNFYERIYLERSRSILGTMKNMLKMCVEINRVLQTSDETYHNLLKSNSEEGRENKALLAFPLYIDYLQGIVVSLEALEKSRTVEVSLTILTLDLAILDQDGFDSGLTVSELYTHFQAVRKRIGTKKEDIILRNQIVIQIQYLESQLDILKSAIRTMANRDTAIGQTAHRAFLAFNKTHTGLIGNSALKKEDRVVLCRNLFRCMSLLPIDFVDRLLSKTFAKSFGIMLERCQHFMEQLPTLCTDYAIFIPRFEMIIHRLNSK